MPMRSFGATIGLFAILVGATSQVALADEPIGILLAAGDISTCGNDNWHRFADKTADIIRKEIKKAKEAKPQIPVRVLALGDLAYRKGTKKEFDCFRARWNFKNALSPIPEYEAFLPVPGNHEYRTPGAQGYFKHFENHPLVVADKGYYAVNFPRANGPWLLIGLNDNLETKKYKKEFAAQLNWLESKLDTAKETNRQDCVLAFWHRPLLSSGRHGHENYAHTKPNAGLENSWHMRRAFQLLYKYGASTVLAGHDHNYEQFSPHDADGKPVNDGIRSFVVGTGGALLTEDFYENLVPGTEGGPFGKNNDNKKVGGNGKTQGVLKIMLFETSYQWEFLPIDGKTKLPLKTTSANCNKRKTPAG